MSDKTYQSFKDIFSNLKIFSVPNFPKLQSLALGWLSDIHIEEIIQNKNTLLFSQHLPAQSRQPVFQTENGGAIQLEEYVLIFKRVAKGYIFVPCIFDIEHNHRRIDGYTINYTNNLYPEVISARDREDNHLTREIIERRLLPEKFYRIQEEYKQNLKNDIEKIISIFSTMGKVENYVPYKIQNKNLILPAYLNLKTSHAALPSTVEKSLEEISKLFAYLFYEDRDITIHLRGQLIGQRGHLSPIRIEARIDYTKIPTDTPFWEDFALPYFIKSHKNIFKGTSWITDPQGRSFYNHTTKTSSSKHELFEIIRKISQEGYDIESFRPKT